ncbi:MAG TPA: very short patch repair endonuclease [Thermoanaerobaculia bacterium]|nr:very short patch repair endonuclease [Thermoanaerobaculia bacterium]
MTGPARPAVSARRSYIMSRVKSRDTGVELALRRALWAAGIRGYRLRWRATGRPDLVFVGRRVAVFVDGCFWHGCRACKRPPKDNVAYWTPKIRRNRARDRKVTRTLEAEGWRVIRLWEHDVRKALPKCIGLIRRSIR